MKIRIEITKGPDSGREFVLNSNERLTIGRGGEAEIQMTDTLISREHCEIKCDGKRVLLRDLGSTNKTFMVQRDAIEAIVPEKVYPVADGGSFFAGPESRFTTTLLSAAPSSRQPSSVPRNPPKPNNPSVSSGNFSNSIENFPGVVSSGDSSISNLLGPIPTTNPNESVQINTQPPQPTYEHHAGSIAPPNQQGQSGQFHSPPIEEAPKPPISPPQTQPNQPQVNVPPPPSEEDSGIFSRSIEAVRPAPPRPLPPAENYSSPPPANPRPPQRIDPQSDYSTPGIESQSIVPVHLQGGGPLREQVGEAIDDEYLKSTPKIDWQDDSQKQDQSPPPKTPVDSRMLNRDSVDRDSIAQPNQIYPQREPVENSQIQNYNAFDSIAPVGHSQPDHPNPQSPPKVAPETLHAPPETPDNLQSNGLYFHTGKDAAQLTALIAEISATAKPLYCVDFTRLEIDPPGSEPSPADADAASPTPEDTHQSPITESATAPSSSAFELDDDVEAEAKTNSTPADAVESACLIGTPLFDFLPVGHEHHGPILLTQDELPCPVEAAWENDAMIVIFSQDPDATLEHLKKLLHTNLQTGKQFKGMFGFCWPSVLHSLLETQGKDQVARIFGEAISFILLEDPQQRFAWNLVAFEDLTNQFQTLKP